jgi:hypothetical protein
MRIRRPVRPAQEITGALCATCRAVRDVERVEPAAETTTFTLVCGHTVTLTPGAVCRLDVQADAIILYLNRADLPVRQGATS